MLDTDNRKWNGYKRCTTVLTRSNIRIEDASDAYSWRSVQKFSSPVGRAPAVQCQSEDERVWPSQARERSVACKRALLIAGLMWIPGYAIGKQRCQKTTEVVPGIATLGEEGWHLRTLRNREAWADQRVRSVVGDRRFYFECRRQAAAASRSEGIAVWNLL